MTVTPINGPWVDAAAPDLAAEQPFCAVHPTFMTVIARADDLTELVFLLQDLAHHGAEVLTAADGKTLNGVAFAPAELEMTFPNADQPVTVCELLMRVHRKGELSRVEHLALFPFVTWEQFTFALSAAGTRRSLQHSQLAARRLQL